MSYFGKSVYSMRIHMIIFHMYKWSVLGSCSELGVTMLLLIGAGHGLPTLTTTKYRLFCWCPYSGSLMIKFYGLFSFGTHVKDRPNNSHMKRALTLSTNWSSTLHEEKPRVQIVFIHEKCDTDWPFKGVRYFSSDTSKCSTKNVNDLGHCLHGCGGCLNLLV